ncbi:MAG: serine hydrolase domain-containing protein, partial [Thermaurantiacus sp.]
VLFSADAIIWSGAVGHADAEGSVAATLDTPYRAGSISKLATSLVAMQLAAEGRLDLDAPVTHYLPDFAPESPFGQAITMRHLLGHRAGLVREPPIGSYFDFGPVPLATVVASLNETRLVAPPGGDPKYSNAGFAVASRVIEVIAGAPFEDVARARLLLPLGMQSSGFRFAELPARPAHAVLNPLGGPRDPAPLEELAAAGAGSLAATGRDLARLGQALLRAARGRADGPVTPAMLQAIIDGPAGERLGLGIIIDALDGHRRIGHGG